MPREARRDGSGKGGNYRGDSVWERRTNSKHTKSLRTLNCGARFTNLLCMCHNLQAEESLKYQTGNLLWQASHCLRKEDIVEAQVRPLGKQVSGQGMGMETGLVASGQTLERIIGYWHVFFFPFLSKLHKQMHFKVLYIAF
ncbi:hypothetical protein E2C01_086451 [Portunus trituberculatus]|uniref:Uncharacterized protein n=1 Tax=Portunus trituberculatus TaxID=210409 RepID=A0A5B7JBI2_PORTR|nr:hypothetical protein [Portunus trituberculatus]